MRKPKLNKLYHYVRISDNGIEHAEFIRYEDGSASYVMDGKLCGVEEDEVAWMLVLEWFEKNSFVEMRDAKANGMIPVDWEPESIILGRL